MSLEFKQNYIKIDVLIDNQAIGKITNVNKNSVSFFHYKKALFLNARHLLKANLSDASPSQQRVIAEKVDELNSLKS